MSESQAVPKPIPEADDISRPFFEAGMREEFVLMKCSNCGAFRLPLYHACPTCLSSESTWEPASGNGIVRTFGIMHQRYHAGFEPELPYNIVVIELEEGPRFTSNLIDVANEDISVGMPVKVAWEQHDDVAIPKFRPA